MATLVRYNPYSNPFDRMVAREFNCFLGWPTTSAAKAAVPAVNVKEDEQAFRLEVAVPGFKKEEFTVSVHNNLLTVSAKQEQNNEEKSEKFTRKEFGFSSFERSFRLPKNINLDQVQATYTDGILKIDLPKVEPAVVEPKQIAVA